jgi:N-acetylglucosaminyldiphosphoundecaprenol N-acetyl-beta-D-mannosaminyltransferase
MNSEVTSRFRVLGVGISPVQIQEVIGRMVTWIIERRRCHYIAVTGMHGVTEAQHDGDFKHILNSADLVVPDGMPLVWLARLRGFALRRRVYGPELMMTFCEQTAARGYRHFLYGGDAGIADRLADSLRERFPGLLIAGSHSPPFRSLTEAEDSHIVAQINESGADVLWIGLSTPKQERWMYEHRDRLCVPVLVGVGAAFDFNLGIKRQAPEWMRERGLEWLFRLLQEPRRLWRRYVLYGSEFLFSVILEQLGLRKFE